MQNAKKSTKSPTLLLWIFCDLCSEALEIFYKIFISSFDIFYIGNTSFSCRDQSCNHYGTASSEIPARNRRALKIHLAEDDRLMGIDDTELTSHFLQFYEPIESSLIEYLVDPGFSTGLRHQDGKE